MRKFLISFCLLVSLSSFGQKINEVGVSVGLASMAGDLNSPWTRPVAVLWELRPSLGLEYRHYFNRRHNIYTCFRVVHVHTNDGNYWNRRGLILNGNITTVDLRYELNLREYSRNTNSVNHQVDKDWWTPYVGIGAVGIYFNPNLQYSGDTPIAGFDDRVGFSYGVQFAGGIKFDLPRGFGACVEFNHNMTFTDRLDGFVSGNYDDWYFQGTLGVYMLILKRGYF